jgi:hypothetical protein
MEELRINLSRGWSVSEPFNAQGQIVTVPAAAGVLAVARTSLLSLVVAPASRIYLRSMSLRVVDMAGYDQIYIALLKNGATFNPWQKISGEQFVDEQHLAIEQEFEPGTFELAATNISGTSEPGAAAGAGDIRLIARLTGFLLKQSR